MDDQIPKGKLNNSVEEEGQEQNQELVPLLFGLYLSGILDDLDIDPLDCLAWYLTDY